MVPIRSLIVMFATVPYVCVGLAGLTQQRPTRIRALALQPGAPYSTVAPLIKAQCVSCHNATRHPEKVDLSSYRAVMKSGEKGPIVIAGHPEKSKLIQYVDGTKQPRMPFKGHPLSGAQISLLKKWIAAGAQP